jgi:hypothetical protein
MGSGRVAADPDDAGVEQVEQVDQSRQSPTQVQTGVLEQPAGQVGDRNRATCSSVLLAVQ